MQVRDTTMPKDWMASIMEAKLQKQIHRSEVKQRPDEAPSRRVAQAPISRESRRADADDSTRIHLVRTKRLYNATA